MFSEEALKKSQNEIEYNKTAAEIEEQIFEKSASRVCIYTVVYLEY